MHSKFRV